MTRRAPDGTIVYEHPPAWPEEPPDDGRAGRNYLLWLGAAAVGLIVIVVVGIMVLKPFDDPQAALLEAIPADIRDACLTSPDAEREAGSPAGVRCELAWGVAWFDRFGTTNQMDDYLDAIVDSQALSPGNCAEERAATSPWNLNDEDRGRMACYVDDSERAWVLWTHDAHAISVTAMRQDSSDAELHGWWEEVSSEVELGITIPERTPAAATPTTPSAAPTTPSAAPSTTDPLPWSAIPLEVHDQCMVVTARYEGASQQVDCTDDGYSISYVAFPSAEDMDTTFDEIRAQLDSPGDDCASATRCYTTWTGGDTGGRLIAYATTEDRAVLFETDDSELVLMRVDSERADVGELYKRWAVGDW